MSQRRLRQKPRISYHELEEPNFDEYVYCEKCGDYVYEYCSIHGPLLVIPDDKVPAKSKFPPNVPRAALSTPHVFLHLASSIIPGAGVGVFATLTLPRGVRFGPYCGQRTLQVNSAYCWQIYDANNKPLHVIDGYNETSSNWMRYVNCARHSREQNLVAYQYQGDVYYRTVKIVPRTTELLVFYGSEYADSLNVNLHKYNSKKHYLEAIGIRPALDYNKRPPETRDAQKSEVTSTTIEITCAENANSKNGTSDDYEIVDDLQYIDDSMISEDNDNCEPVTFEFNSEKQCFNIKFHDNDKPDHNFTKFNEEETKLNNYYQPLNIYNQPFTTNEENRNATKNITNDKEIQVNLIWENYKSLVNTDDQVAVDLNNQKQRVAGLDGNIESNKVENEMCNVKEEYKHNFSELITDDKVTWQCNKCLKILTSRTSLRKHAKNHSEIKKYNCAQCKYNTHIKIRLEQHMSKHTGKYEHKCELCSFATNTSRNLGAHVQRMHENMGKSEYKCELCSFVTNTSRNLRAHVQRMHENGESNSCEFCSYKNGRKALMEYHRAMHDKKNAIKCDFCDYLGSRKKYLQSHVKAIHQSLKLQGSND